MKKIKSSEITPEHLYLNRREFLKSMGIVSASAALLAACAPESTSAPATSAPVNTSPTEAPVQPQGGYLDNLGELANPYDHITNFNNYYEFTVDKEAVAQESQHFKTSPWTVEIGGMVNNPVTLDMDDIKSQFEQEDRVYRLRCVEGWSMVIPWVGFPISKIIDMVEPTSSAKFVRFESVYDPDQMPGQSSRWYEWPYIEGLTMAEAQNDLAILATGLYGKDLPIQNGAPLRLAVPWKYGFKSVKAITKIEFTDEQPISLWMAAAPNEYGFYANVNPQVNHPRWSQATERRIGESGRRDTLMFNGYEEEVAYLYEGLDLARNY
jgi:sulfoxide reductase catalytic subunit YedY